MTGRMKFLGITIIALVTQAYSDGNNTDMFVGIETFQDYYHLPKLPYSYDAMEPWIDAKTMEMHHYGHHSAYTAKMNAALQEWRKSVIHLSCLLVVQ